VRKAKLPFRSQQDGSPSRQTPNASHLANPRATALYPDRTQSNRDRGANADGTDVPAACSQNYYDPIPRERLRHDTK
jgi:hypothetical protein